MLNQEELLRSGAVRFCNAAVAAVGERLLPHPPPPRAEVSGAAGDMVLPVHEGAMEGAKSRILVKG